MGWSTRQKQIRTKGLSKKLEENYGVDTSDDAIRKAVEEHNKICRIITEIGEYRKEENPRITGYEFHILNLVTYVCPKYLILDRLQETLEEIRNREPDEKKNYRARVVIAGSEIDDPDFTKLVEEAGALVVADRFCFGSFPGRQEIHIGEEEDALKAVCRRYMEDSQCARYMSHEKIQARRDFVRKLYEDYHADGIIYEQLKFCDYWGYERALVSHIMQEEYELPVLSVDRPYRAGSSGQMRTRIQAFVERMEIKKIQNQRGGALLDKKIEELLEKGKELKTQGSEILKKEKKTVSRAFHAWKDMDHHKGDVHTGELTTAFREWRGVKDTAYDFAKWLQVWGDMSLMIMKNPVGSVKGTVEIQMVQFLSADPHVH